jgi:alanine-glyoxylate transaminase/serine-glyoxylate transaminase/serine-pyruvate transaminase
MVRNYWSKQSRAYHHTAPINMNYALHAALREVLGEGLAVRQARHLSLHQAFAAGITALGLEFWVRPEIRLPVLNTIRIPEGIADQPVRAFLLQNYGVEIGAGLGSMAGKAWRIGLMGESCRIRNVLLVLAALEGALRAQGFACSPGSGVAAAQAAWKQA